MNKKDYKLVWSEEFDYEGKPDPSKWGSDVGNEWHNNELQAYTARPPGSTAILRSGRSCPPVWAPGPPCGSCPMTSGRVSTGPCAVRST